MVRVVIGCLMMLVSGVAAADTVPFQSSADIEAENCEVLRAVLRFNYGRYLCSQRPLPLSILDWRDPFPVGRCETPLFKLIDRSRPFRGCYHYVTVVRAGDHYRATFRRGEITDTFSSFEGNIYGLTVRRENGQWVARAGSLKDTERRAADSAPHPPAARGNGDAPLPPASSDGGH